MMLVKRLLAIFIAISLIISCSSQTKDKGIKEIENSIKSGDIIFQSTNSRQCEAVKLATNSEYSHVGIVFEIDGELMVYEAVQPVKKTPLDDWISHGEGGHYEVKRLKKSKEILTDSTLAEMINIANDFLGKNYDIYFEWSDEKIYCSELVWKIYKEATGIEIGVLKKLEDFDLTSELVKSIMLERYGDNVPLDETVISPEGMLNSDKLVLIERK